MILGNFKNLRACGDLVEATFTSSILFAALDSSKLQWNGGEKMFFRAVLCDGRLDLISDSEHFDLPDDSHGQKRRQST